MRECLSLIVFPLVMRPLVCNIYLSLTCFMRRPPHPTLLDRPGNIR